MAAHRNGWRHVETIKRHENAFGDKVEKAVGARYWLPDAHAAQLEAQELVKPVTAKAAVAQDPPTP
jgi:hypothetical protein